MERSLDPAGVAYDRRVASLLLVLLLVGDAALFVTHVLNPIVLKNPLLSLARDGGYPEFYQYLKFLWLAVIAAALYRRTSAPGYLGWTMLFLYLLADDAALLHEVYGTLIAQRITFTPPFGLRPQDIGELAASAVAGSILLPLLWLAYRHSDAACKAVSRQLVLLFAALVFFGIVVDMLHSMIKINYYVSFAFATLEDGGEMLVVSVMLWYAAAVYLADDAPSAVRADRLLRHVARNRRAAGAPLVTAVPAVGH